jgi:hypothetical protein
VRVTIVRGGGLAGLVRRTELDSAELPPEAVALLCELVDRLPTDRPRAGGVAPDEPRYELALDDGGRKSSWRQTEQALSEDERLLIAFVDGRAERVDSVEPL